MSAAASRRESSRNLLSTLDKLSSLKPKPPDTPRGSLLLDITNGGNDAEVARLSGQALDLMTKLQQRDHEVQRLENFVATQQKEVASLAAQVSHLQRERTQPTSAPPSSGAASARAMPAVPGAKPASHKMPPSPSKLQQAVLLKTMTKALKEADTLTALRVEELGAARAMLQHLKSKGGQSTSDVLAPGVVARLQADLSEAAEERRTLRQQLQSQREWGKELQSQLAERASQLADTERARQALESRFRSNSIGAEESKKLLGDLRAAQTAVNNSDARNEDLERRLQMAQARAHELGQQLAQVRKELQAAMSSRTGAADEMGVLRGDLQSARDEASASRRRAEEACASAAKASDRAERAEAERERLEAEVRRGALETVARTSDCKQANARLAEAEEALLELRRRLSETEAAAREKAEALEKLEASARDASKRSEARLNEMRLQAQKLDQKLSLATEAEAAAGRQAGEAARKLSGAEAARDGLEAKLREKEREVTALGLQLAPLRDEASKASAEAKRSRGEVNELNAKIQKLQAELRAQQQAQSDLKKDKALEESADAQRRLREEAQRAQEELQREQAARREAEEKLREARERTLKHQKTLESMAKAVSAKEVAKEPSVRGGAQESVGWSAAADSDDLSELRRKLKATEEELLALKDEMERKKEQWRITALKRHAESNKLEQALKVSQKNESLLKKKADMLELTLLSHQKSMDKGRASMVTAQLKEHNERLEQQTAIKDMHAQATQRATFQQTYDKQMIALDGKLRRLDH
mmetsp:Transcript_27943/g.69407  ORF Transcript_27943/g.69407 Transcript_27943/m.69407 type:complete len:768 (+) Transcript_27943:176-2479(+)